MPPGGVWAKRCKPIPIERRYHQLKVVKYILDHELRGAAISAMDGIKTRSQLRALRRKTDTKPAEDIPTDLAIE